MLLSRESFDELSHEFNLTEDEVEVACNFLQMLLEEEAVCCETRYPAATRTINNLKKTAYQIFEIGSDISAGRFDDE